jgi:hypothetical protein
MMMARAAATTTTKARNTPTSDISRDVASLFFPFWRFDAKGGEVVLFRFRGICKGRGTSSFFYLYLICMLVFHLC